MPTTRVLALAMLCGLAAAPLAYPLPAQPPAAHALFTRAELDWQAGRYPDALARLDSVLASPDAAEYRERVALLTGENWHTTHVADDARAPRWSPDGRFIAYEGGTGAARWTRVALAVEGFPVVAEVAGSGVEFAPSARRVAWLEGGAPSARLVVAAVPATPPRASGLVVAPPRLAAEPVALGDLTPLQLRFADDSTLLVVGTPAGSQRSMLSRVRLTAGGAVAAVTTVAVSDSLVADLQVAPGGRVAVVGVGGRPPLAAGGRATGFARAGGRPQFAIVELATGRTRVLAGSAPVLSARGAHVAWFTRTATRNQLHVAPLGALLEGADTPRPVFTSAEPLDAPALSPDGARVAVQQLMREDWELVTVDVASAAATRVTREIQHDLLPQWLDDTRLLAVMGEARHRRSYLYDGGVRRRLFHNNTVRTIAPEYEWVPSPDGRRVLVVAERDGDTVTPHRHLWCVDLTREVTVAELRARVAEALRAEQALRADGARAFAPIADAVRAAVAEVSVDRVYGYSFDLFQFDSKHVTQPGNAKARAYLEAAYRSFGYTDVRQQAFEARAGLDRPAVPTANVLAVLPGTVHPELVYVISSHFDSRAEGPGADDNTSGTAVLLETARVLASRPQAATIVFASLTGEESGLLGSREFVRVAKAEGMRLAGVLNNDMVGWANDQRLDNTIRYSNPGIRDLQHQAALGFSDLITYDAFYYKSTDAQAFYDGYGDIVGGIGSYPVLGNPHYHMPHDVLETINHRLVAEVAKTTVASIMYLASAPSRLTGLVVAAEGATGARVAWTPSPERDVVRYEVAWGPAGAPMRHRLEVTAPEATLRDAPVGTVVQVRAVNRRGLTGWDWARGTRVP